MFRLFERGKAGLMPGLFGYNIFFGSALSRIFAFDCSIVKIAYENRRRGSPKERGSYVTLADFLKGSMTKYEDSGNADEKRKGVTYRLLFGV